jgi:SAM-dependent methyltransferase
MIAGARRAAERRRFSNVRFEVGSADLLSFTNDNFDAVVSRFGVMFFPSPVDGIREMLRVLKSKRKLVMAVWHFAERNPFHYLLSRVADRYVEPDPVPADSPDAFRFAFPGKLVGVLTEAGAAVPSERLLQFRIEVPLSAGDFWTFRSGMSDKLRTKLGTLSNDTLAAIRHEVLQDLDQYSTGRDVSFPAEVLIVSGTKAG